MPPNLAADNSTHKAAIRDCEISPLILQSPPNVKVQETYMKLGALISLYAFAFPYLDDGGQRLSAFKNGVSVDPTTHGTVISLDTAYRQAKAAVIATVTAGKHLRDPNEKGFVTRTGAPCRRRRVHDPAN